MSGRASSLRSSELLRRWWALSACLVVVCLIVSAMSGTASAAPTQDEAASDGTLTITEADATDPEALQLKLVYTGKATKADLLLNGEPAGSAQLEPDPVGQAVIVVADNNEASQNAATQLVTQAVGEFSPDAEAGRDQMALVSTGGTARTVMPLSGDSARLDSDIARFGLAGEDGDAIFDGLVLGTELAASSTLDRQIVLIRTGAEDGSGNTVASVRRALMDSHVTLSVIDAAPNSPDAATLSGWAADSGGVYVASAPNKLLDATAMVNARLGGRYSLTAPVELTNDRSNVSVVLSDATAEASVQPGSLLTTPAQLKPVPLAGRSLLSRLDNPLVRLAVPAMVLLALLGIGVAAMQFMTHSEDSVDARLRAYSGADALSPEDAADSDMIFGSSEVVRKAVEATEHFAEDRGLLAKIQAQLTAADLHIRAGEAAFALTVIPLVAGFFGLGLFGIAGGLMLALLGLAVPIGAVSVKAGRRRSAFERQLPDALTLLAGTLRAGYSIGQAITAVSEDVPDPLGGELRRAMSEAQLGRPIEDALTGVAERLTSRDFAWTVLAISIQREVGGNLSELLDTVATTMVERERLRREVKGLTAEGRMSAIVLGALPLGMMAFMYVSNPGYLDPLLETTLGKVLLGYSVVSMLIGFAWMKKIITIEV
ncbi:MAG: type II secretion system F family protein [Microthrixaceae bacterium]